MGADVAGAAGHAEIVGQCRAYNQTEDKDGGVVVAFARHEELATARALGARYTLTSLLGRGATGEVWLGAERRSGRRVAAKLLRPEYLEDDAVVDRFVRERTILLGLRHPGIVSVIDLIVDGEDLAIVMDYLEGGSLRRVLQEDGPLEPARKIGRAHV